MKRYWPLLLLAATAPALAQTRSIPLGPPPARTALAQPRDAAAPPPAPAPGPMTLNLRGLDKITGRATDISAPIGKTVKFATLTITARYCYSTPASETPETAAFVQIDDHRPDQKERRVFSGWMKASSPGLNGMEHPLYDVWVISCGGGAAAPAAIAARAPPKVASPDSSDKEKPVELPAGASQ